MRYYLIAGERSGDLHGSNLIKALRKVDAQAEFRGYGGDYMKEAGMDLIVHYRELAFMGVVQVIANLRTITKRLNQCKIDIVEYKPDVVILIDYADFNLRVAQHARQHGIKTFYYISPKVWAWRQKRALKLKANVDRMFCILPFEKDFYRKFDWDVDYVGNPVLDAVKGFTPNPEFRKKNKLKKEDKLIGLLPGSRSLELKRIIPLMSKVVELNPDETFIVAGVTSLPRELYSEIEAYKNVKIIFDETYDLLSNSHAAIVTSGTATLETALFKVPQMVVYKAGRVEYFIGSRFVDLRFISLVNLIADQQVIVELLQDKATVPAIHHELQKLVAAIDYREEIVNHYEKIFRVLDTGSASQTTADLMMKYLKG